jgi:hypothetical protein
MWSQYYIFDSPEGVSGQVREVATWSRYICGAGATVRRASCREYKFSETGPDPGISEMPLSDSASACTSACRWLGHTPIASGHHGTGEGAENCCAGATNVLRP